jgi:Domain of unknown function (DUF1905)
MEIEFSGTVWKWQGDAAWYFVSLPEEYYDELKLFSKGPKKGFGSIRVEATIGTSTWKTSIFPDSKTKSYLLPVKKLVRTNEKLEDDTVTKVSLRLIEI